ncbi:DUF4386 family protein [Nocardioides stalactiti]|uniref:DUF4386 family protein n=1 Tax=Nocardioides stalactiti TaxID=2755356 RepID=UPI001C7E5DD0|nr:DUF4386 family protein [Nocardioides stalactiti]
MKRILDIAALGGPAAVVVTLVGWLIAGMLPLPMGPGESTPDVVSFFTEEPNRVMAGFVLSSIGVVLMIPMLVLVSVHLLRMEGRVPLMAFTQLLAAAVTVVINMFPQLIFAIAAFRTDRDPGDIVLLNDLAWLLLFTGITPFMVQNVAIALAILRDKSEVFPRWLAYLNLLVAFAFIPDVLAYFFKSGPFAWNGVFVFWLALTAYCAFLVAMSYACRKANETLMVDRDVVLAKA